jgi:hypothetical protein
MQFKSDNQVHEFSQAAWKAMKKVRPGAVISYQWFEQNTPEVLRQCELQEVPAQGMQ